MHHTKFAIPMNRQIFASDAHFNVRTNANIRQALPALCELVGQCRVYIAYVQRIVGLQHI